MKPTTAVVTEHDVTVPLEEISVPTGSFAFVRDDIFEVPDGTPLPIVTYEAMRRSEDNLINERNQAILFYYSVAQWNMLRDGGTLSLAPAPLSEDEIRAVFRQLMNLTQYKGFVLTTTANDGTEVTMKETGT